jgi:serine phosphatase RsbU (regulator of sigma subunit)
MPHNWAKNPSSRDHRGYGWYRVRVDALSTGDQSVGIRFLAEDADEAWFNGEKIGATGDPAQGIHAHDRTRVYLVPQRLVRGQNLLALRIYSTETRNKGIPKTVPEIGAFMQMVRDTDRSGYLKAIFSAGFLVVAGFSLVIFFRRMRGREYLWFALFAFFIAGYTFLYGQPLRFDIADSFNAWKKLEYLFLVPIHCFIFFFILSMFGITEVRVRSFPVWTAVAALLGGITAVCWLVILFTKSLPVWDFINKDIIQRLYLVFIPVTLGIIIHQAAVRKDRNAFLILASTVIFFISALLDVASDAALIPFPRVAWFGFVFVVCSIAGILSSRFVTLYGRIEQLNIELEQRVLERTDVVVRQRDELEKQIGMARRIQQSILPRNMPQMTGGVIAYTYRPMMQVGGDFIDLLYDRERDRLSVFICDVSGNGVGAAFLSSMVKMSLSAWNLNAGSPAAVLTSVHESLAGKIEDHFVTACAVTVDFRSGRMSYASAGHNPLLVMRGGSDPFFLQAKGRVISGKFPPAIEEAGNTLEPGDRLVLYTDGIIETRDARGDLFGEERFVSALRASAGLPPGPACDALVSRVAAYSTARGPQEDDITLVIMDYRGIGS